MKSLSDNSVDLIIADPPYYRILKDNWDNQWKSENEYFNWCKQWIIEFKRILKPNGSIYIWNWFDNICTLGYISKQQGFIIRNLITWMRGGGRERNNWSSQKEDLLYLTLTDHPTFNLDDVLIGLNDDCRVMKRNSWKRYEYNLKGRKSKEQSFVNPSNVWSDSYITYNSPEKVNHPSQKPLSICNRIVKASSNENDLVYIPFAGSGSEIIACIRNNRNWIATETNKDYIDNIIKPRIRNIKL